MSHRKGGGRAVIAVLVGLLAAVADAATVRDELLNSMSYRLVGPFRGGRVTAVAGVPGDPMTYYMGSTGGGVWKTTDAGLSWRNVSDAVRELEQAASPQVMGEVDPELAAAGRLRPPVGGLPSTPLERPCQVRSSSHCLCLESFRRPREGNLTNTEQVVVESGLLDH